FRGRKAIAVPDVGGRRIVTGADDDAEVLRARDAEFADLVGLDAARIDFIGIAVRTAALRVGPADVVADMSGAGPGAGPGPGATAIATATGHSGRGNERDVPEQSERGEDHEQPLMLHLFLLCLVPLVSPSLAIG